MVMIWPVEKILMLLLSICDLLADNNFKSTQLDYFSQKVTFFDVKSSGELFVMLSDPSPCDDDVSGGDGDDEQLVVVVGLWILLLFLKSWCVVG